MAADPPTNTETVVRPLADPWEEQRRRRRVHRRRRNKRIAIGALVVVAVAAVAGLAIVAWEGDDDGGAERGAGGGAPDVTAPDVAVPDAAGTSGAAADPDPTSAPPTTSLADPGTELSEVWLIDRLDGTFDWGVVLASTDEEARGPITVEARLVDASGDVVIEDTAEISVLPSGERAAIGGRVRADVVVRVETDVTVAGVLDGEPLGPLDVRAVERRPAAGAGGGDVLIGRIASGAAADVEDLTLAAMWRDEAGAVIAAVFLDVQRVRPTVEARFEIPLDDPAIPSGPPADVLLAR